MENIKKNTLIVIGFIVAGGLIFCELVLIKQKDITSDELNNEKGEVSGKVESAQISRVFDKEKTNLTNNIKTSILTTSEGARVLISYAQFPPEIDSVVGLLNISTDIFIGKVNQRIGFVSQRGYPTTQYSVQVFSRISGGAPKNIILFQGGVGLSNKTGNFYATDEDVGHIISNKINPEDIYLKTDGIYLFVARHDSSLNIYGISAPPYDRELITTDATLTDAQVLSAAENNPRVREFMNAAGIKTLQSAYQ